MIQDRPICFDCETPVESLVDAVFANPWFDEPDAPSAIFHPICLMRWRERRDQIKEAVWRHFTNQCSCNEADEEGNAL